MLGCVPLPPRASTEAAQATPPSNQSYYLGDKKSLLGTREGPPRARGPRARVRARISIDDGSQDGSTGAAPCAVSGLGCRHGFSEAQLCGLLRRCESQRTAAAVPLPGQTWLQPASSHHAARSDLTALAGNLAPALQTTGDGATWARTTRRRVASPPTSTSSLRKG